MGELERANAALAEARESLVRAERLATAGQLAAGIAHEVGNPLGAISGYAELARARLRDGGPAAVAQAAEFAERIVAETARIDRIVRDLLDSRAPERAGGAAGAASRGPLDAALRLARAQPRFRAVEVTEDVPADLPPALADEQRLAQVLLNLLLNAGDAIGGAGAVRVSARADGAAIELAVEDGGPGSPPRTCRGCSSRSSRRSRRGRGPGSASPSAAASSSRSAATSAPGTRPAAGRAWSSGLRRAPPDEA